MKKVTSREGLRAPLSVLLMLGAALCALALSSTAAEIRVLSAVALAPVLEEISGEFERTSGHKLSMEFVTGGSVLKRMQAGEAIDLVIAPANGLANLAKDAKVDPKSLTPVAKTGVGIVVRTGSAKPNVQSVDDLKKALLAAKTVVYADPAGGGVAGTHVRQTIEKLGIAEQLKARLKLGKGGDVTEVTLAQGEGAIGMTQISEIVGKPGAEFVGPFPESIQMYTAFSAAIGVGAKQPEAAAALIKYFKTPATIGAMKLKGMQPG